MLKTLLHECIHAYLFAKAVNLCISADFAIKQHVMKNELILFVFYRFYTMWIKKSDFNYEVAFLSYCVFETIFQLQF